jgi:hypothetical protein
MQNQFAEFSFSNLSKKFKCMFGALARARAFVM